MATKIDTDLFKRMRDAGVRKSRAKEIAKSVQDKTPKQAQKAISDLQGVVAEIQSRITGGPDRSAAARKAAATRRSDALKRSQAARKAARTRARATA